MTREERRAAKQAARGRIAWLLEKILAATNRVPERVINGTHQEAVRWKSLAINVRTHSVFKKTGDTLSLAALEARADSLNNYLEKLT